MTFELKVLSSKKQNAGTAGWSRPSVKRGVPSFQWKRNVPPSAVVTRASSRRG